MHTLPLPLNIALKLLVRAISWEKKKRKRNKVFHIEKEKVNISLFTDYMILYAENPKDATPK